MTTTVIPILDDLEAWFLEETTDDQEPCKHDDRQATHTLTTRCGYRTPLCLTHAEEATVWLHKHAHERHQCKGWQGTVAEHFEVAPLA